MASQQQCLKTLPVGTCPKSEQQDTMFLATNDTEAEHQQASQPVLLSYEEKSAALPDNFF